MGGKAGLQAILAGHEIVYGKAGARGLLDRQRVSDEPGLQASVGHVVESALVRVDPIAVGEVVQIADRPIAGCRGKQLDLAAAKARADQVAMEALEPRRGETAGLTATPPAGLVQRFQPVQHRQRLFDALCRA